MQIDSDISNVIGNIAGIITVASYAPQVVRAWRTRSTRDLSWWMIGLLITSGVLWIAYGVMRHSFPIVATNVGLVLMVGAIAVAKAKHDRAAGAALVILLALAGLAAPARAQRPEALWYMTDGESSVQSFLANAERIDVVAPQVYSMDSLGVIWGSVDRRVVERARERGVKLVPLVMNPGFDQPSFHRVLTVADARARAIRNLAALCRDNRFAGIQFDFENIAVTDRDAFTSFARESADSLHRAGCTLSAAVVPRASDFPGPTPYHRWIYENWRGAYDYKALADALDFISLMTYAQHTGGTTPGPVAGYPWMEAALRYTLSLGVPPSKLSLGIPAYSDWWFPTWDALKGARTAGHDVSHATAMGVLARNGVTPVWDDVQKSPYAMFQDDGTNQFVFVEDARAFAAKLRLVSQYKLRGYSVWVLGLEDPAVWQRVPR